MCMDASYRAGGLAEGSSRAGSGRTAASSTPCFACSVAACNAGKAALDCGPNPSWAARQLQRRCRVRDRSPPGRRRLLAAPFTTARPSRKGRGIGTVTCLRRAVCIAHIKPTLDICPREPAARMSGDRFKAGHQERRLDDASIEKTIQNSERAVKSDVLRACQLAVHRRRSVATSRREAIVGGTLRFRCARPIPPRSKMIRTSGSWEAIPSHPSSTVRAWARDITGA